MRVKCLCWKAIDKFYKTKLLVEGEARNSIQWEVGGASCSCCAMRDSKGVFDAVDELWELLRSLCAFLCVFLLWVLSLSDERDRCSTVLIKSTCDLVCKDTDYSRCFTFVPSVLLDDSPIVAFCDWSVNLLRPQRYWLIIHVILRASFQDVRANICVAQYGNICGCAANEIMFTSPASDCESLMAPLENSWLTSDFLWVNLCFFSLFPDWLVGGIMSVTVDLTLLICSSSLSIMWPHARKVHPGLPLVLLTSGCWVATAMGAAAAVWKHIC